MTSVAESEMNDPDLDDGGGRPWWRDWDVLIPVLSGVAFLTGLVYQWLNAPTVALVAFWIGLFLGASSFAPGSLRKLFTRGQPSIGLLMTISAVGSVILGYVEEAAALAFLYSISESLEDKAMNRARAGLSALLRLVPETATIRKDARTEAIPIRNLRIGDLLIVHPGERIATDGIVKEGYSSIDASAITGESIPIEVEPGDQLPAGAINSSRVLQVKATAEGANNSLTMVVDLVTQAQADKGKRARLADRIAKPLVPGVMILAILVAAVGSIFSDPEQWITRALVVLVAASPCALAIAVPVTVVSAIGSASKFGVVIKSGAAFERFGGIRHFAVDKTGTLTRNQPIVSRVLTAPGQNADNVLRWAASVEQHSNHPLADAIVSAKPGASGARDVTETAGHGITGLVDGVAVTVGNPRWLECGPLRDSIDTCEKEGMTVVIVHFDGTPVGAIGVRDELRPEVPEVIASLRNSGVEVTMLTGDNEQAARAIATQAGISEVRAELRPEDKAEAVAEMKRELPTAMIGDGINDAPALAGADVGIAMGVTGSDAAIESADIAFTGHDLRLLPLALQHARRGRTIIIQNIVLSLLIIAVLLPLAIFGMLGLSAVVLVHEVAEVVVILNGLRAACGNLNGVEHSDALLKPPEQKI